MSFRIGRKFAQHVYPEPRRSGGAGAFARNSALAEPIGTVLDNLSGTRVAWTYIESEGSAAQPSDTFNVPITAQSTGIMRIIGTVQLENTDGDAKNVTISVQINGVALTGFPPVAASTVPAPFGEGETPAVQTIPFVIDLILTDPVLLAGVPLPVGVEKNISILLTPSDTGMILGPVTIDIQELPVATG